MQIVDLEGMVPHDHILRKIDPVVDFTHIYDLVEHLYCQDNGRPAVDPAILVKMVLIQHLYGIKSLRQTVKEIDMNITYSWFLGFDLGVTVPHFATVSYAFAQRQCLPGENHKWLRYPVNYTFFLVLVLREKGSDAPPLLLHFGYD